MKALRSTMKHLLNQSSKSPLLERLATRGKAAQEEKQSKSRTGPLWCTSALTQSKWPKAIIVLVTDLTSPWPKTVRSWRPENLATTKFSANSTRKSKIKSGWYLMTSNLNWMKTFQIQIQTCNSVQIFSGNSSSTAWSIRMPRHLIKRAEATRRRAVSMKSNQSCSFKATQPPRSWTPAACLLTTAWWKTDTENKNRATFLRAKSTLSMKSATKPKTSCKWLPSRLSRCSRWRRSGRPWRSNRKLRTS